MWFLYKYTHIYIISGDRPPDIKHVNEFHYLIDLQTDLDSN